MKEKKESEKTANFAQQSVNQPIPLTYAKEYPLNKPGLRRITSQILYAVLVDRKRQLGLGLLGLAMVTFFLAAVFPIILNINIPAAVRLVLWLVFGTASVWGGALLGDILHPERQLFQNILESLSRSARAISDPDQLLDRITTTLHTTLKPESLTIWRYDHEDNVLNLLRGAGTMPHNDLSELPFDLMAEQLHGTWFVTELPESALSRGLRAAGVRVVTSLSSGNDLVGIIGMGHIRDGLRLNRNMFHGLDLVAGQLAIVVKNALLITDLTSTLQSLHWAYRRTIDAQDDERRNLAAELHDDILGRLTTMALTLRKSQHNLVSAPEKVHAWLQNLETETQTINHRLREITQGMHPSVLTDLGLISAMRAYMDSLSRQPLAAPTLKTITLTAQGFDYDRISTPKLERDLYYITRQAIDNAIKHAHADQIYIHLRWGETAISVTVRDTGHGMARPLETLMGQNGHLGLLSMNERTLAWQGKITFHTAPGQGTTIRARLPVNQPSGTPAHLQAFTQYLN